MTGATFRPRRPRVSGFQGGDPFPRLGEGPVVDRVPVVDAAAAVTGRRVGGVGHSSAARGVLLGAESHHVE